MVKFITVFCCKPDPPKITGVRPDGKVTASLYNRTVLQCQADGNPAPTYQWLQKMTTAEETVYVRGSDPMLVIHNVTYDFQGKYICKATNVISGTERTTQSNPIDLSVFGKKIENFILTIPR